MDSYFKIKLKLINEGAIIVIFLLNIIMYIVAVLFVYKLKDTSIIFSSLAMIILYLLYMYFYESLTIYNLLMAIIAYPVSFKITNTLSEFSDWINSYIGYFITFSSATFILFLILELIFGQYIS